MPRPTPAMTLLALGLLIVIVPASSLKVFGDRSEAVSVWEVILSSGLDTSAYVDMASSGCGFTDDCTRSYDLQSVGTAAELQTSPEKKYAAAQQKIHDRARAACARDSDQVLETGGWCYNADKSRLVHAGPRETDVDYLLPPGHVTADAGFVSAIAEHILLKPNGDCCYTLTDLGAGVGQFGHALKSRLPMLEYHGYDAGGNVDEFTHNFVKFADLSTHVSFKPTDWVISSEVGEHVPNQFEKQFITNIHAANCKGVVLTWAVLQQGGKHHVNCHSNQYMIDVFSGLGYTFNQKMSTVLREGVGSSPWLRHSTMVFERVQTPAHC
mmetsp:Transcript_36372/g.54383  ORF Transcript_36372/g.54383 Transcript_36372/m.54383 type:complete len:325 (-) Transcript_36372:74-1048(-)